MDIYREEILDHYKHPRNFGDLDNATHRVREANASCGDLIELSLNIRKKGKRSVIVDVRFGMDTKEAQALDDRDIFELIGSDISSTRMKCVLLPLRALKRALSANRTSG